MLKTTSTPLVSKRARKIVVRLERHDAVTVALDRLRDCVDRLGRIVFRFAIVAALGRDALHVEREADAQRRAARLRARLGLIELREETRARARGTEHGHHGGVVVEPVELRGDRERTGGLEARERRRAEEKYFAVAADAKIEVAKIANAERGENSLRQIRDAALRLRRERRAIEPGGRALRRRERVVVNREATRVARVDAELDGRKNVALREAVDFVDAHVDAGNVALEQDAIRIRVEELVDRATEVDRIFRDARLRNALRRAFVVRLRDGGPSKKTDEVVETAPPQARARDESTARRRDAASRENFFGERFVERDAERVRVAARRGHAELFEERSVEPAAHASAAAFRDVEDDVRRVRLEARDEPRRRTAHVDALDVVAGASERAREGVDGFGRVELGVFDGVGETEVVCERDSHFARRISRNESGYDGR